MSFECCQLRLIVVVLYLSSCASDERVKHETDVRTSALELECGSAPAALTGDVTAVLSSIEPLDPSQPQAYGSAACGGVVFEYDNPDEEVLRGAWIQAGASAESIGRSRCHERKLEADYWGYEDRAWTRLASVSSTGVFEPPAAANDGYCRLEALIEHGGTFSKLRVVARVSEGPETYPMYACVW